MRDQSNWIDQKLVIQQRKVEDVEAPLGTKVFVALVAIFSKVFGMATGRQLEMLEMLELPSAMKCV